MTQTVIPDTFTALEHENRSVVNTVTAAYHLNRQPQTLRLWACKNNGPIQPIRIWGRLGWKVDDIKRLSGLM